MDIEHSPSEALQRFRPEHAHEAGQNDPVDLRTDECIADCRIPGVAVRGDSRVEKRGWNVFVGGEGNSVAGPIGQDEPYLTSEQPALFVTAQCTQIRPDS
jgi:dissimilatory sulfite reductase (desulfoviridin) alpha/beta subunit